MAFGTGWWLVGTERTVSEHVAGPPDAVREFYADLRNIVHVHPLVVSVTSTDRTDTGAGYSETYRVRDRIPIGPFAMGVAYTACVRVPLVGDVHTDARQFPRVRLVGTVSFDADPAGTLLTERLLITAPRPLAAFTVREAVKAHQEMLSGIRQHFDHR